MKDKKKRTCIWLIYCLGVVLGFFIDNIPLGVGIGIICSAVFGAVYEKFKKPTDTEKN